MNLAEHKYLRYDLVREMMETVNVIKQFDKNGTAEIAKTINVAGKLLLTGEGSSRIFPAKNSIRKAARWGAELNIYTEGSRQAFDYMLQDYCCFLASNSGKTKEVITLAEKISEQGNNNCLALTAFPNTPLEQSCTDTFVLNCGKENAVAATKSVVEQALFYESILWNILGNSDIFNETDLSEKINYVLTMPIKQEIIDMAVNASIIYFAGYNDGVAEELTLKTNEIARKKSDYLEGTYAVHGIEEVLDEKDIIFIIDPIEDEIDKFQQVLVDGVGINVVALSTKETPFTTILIPDTNEMNPYLFLCTGWNLLVEIGLSLGSDLDKPVRARKVGNEYFSNVL